MITIAAVREYFINQLRFSKFTTDRTGDKTIEMIGASFIADEDILRSARLWPGKNIDIEDIQNSIKFLWKLGRFSDVQIFIENETINGIELMIDVKEFPILNKIIFKGNKKISKKTLEEKVEAMV